VARDKRALDRENYQIGLAKNKNMKSRN